MAERERFTLQQLRTLVATVAGSGIVFLDSSLANVALPAIQRDLHMTTAQQQWVASAYLLTLSTLLLVGGRLADIHGRRRAFLAGLVAYAVFAVAAALAPGATTLVIARALQGVAGALLVPTSLALVNASFPREMRGRAIGTWSAWSGIATVAGPIAGGLLIDVVVWRVAFLLAPVFAAMAMAAGLALSESRDDLAPRRIDLPGAGLIVVAVGGPVFALIQGPVGGWSSPAVLAGLGAGALAWPAFVRRERTAAAPMVPPELFANRDVTAANVATLFIYAALYGSFFYLILYVQSALGVSAAMAGAAFVPITLLLFVLSPRAGRLNDRHGPRLLMTLGPLGISAGFAIMCFTGPGQVFTIMLPGILVLGVGLGFTVAPLTTTAIGSAEERYSGVASGVNNAVSRIAALIAIAVLGLAVVAVWRYELAEGSTRARLGPEGRTALSAVRDTAFVLPPPDGAEAEKARTVALGAAQKAFRFGMLLAAALSASGAAVSGVFIGAGSTAPGESRARRP